MKKQAQFLSSGGDKRREYLIRESMELTLTDCGYEVCLPGVPYPPQKQSYYTLLAIRSGEGTCTLNGVSFRAEALDLILITPGTEYAFVSDVHKGCTCLWADFTGIRAEACMLYAGFTSQQPCRKTQCLHQLEKVLTQALMPEGTLVHQIRANGLFQMFLGDLIEEYAPSASSDYLRQARGPKTSDYVKNAIDYLSKHYQESIKIKELADNVGINRSYFASSFKKATGYSPKEYLLSLRMEKARHLLETTEMPISSVSVAVGYEDPLAFSRIFKRHSGLSPTDYRQENKSNFQ